jgi:hypothetical protein
MSGAGLRFGVGRATITPPAGIWLSGFSSRDAPMQGVRDDLYATALVLGDEHPKVALVTCDLLGLPVAWSRELRRQIAQSTGIHEAAVVVACSHTHSGPTTGIVYDPQHGVAAYMPTLALYLVGAVRMACSHMEPGTVRVARSRAAIGINRRAGLGNGRGSDSVDDSVTLLHILRQDGGTGALVVQCSCHPVTLGHENLSASADYIGVAREIVEQVTGDHLLFVQGACGDTNPRSGIAGTDQHAQRTGRLLAAEILRLHELAEPGGNDIATASCSVELPVQPPPPRDKLARQVAEGDALLQTLRQTGASPGTVITAAFPIEWARHMLAATDAGHVPHTITYEVVGLCVGPLGLVAVPLEPFATTGIAVRGRGALPYSVLAGYVNGCAGYLPTPDAYEVGGYEVAVAHHFLRAGVPLAAGAEPVVRSTALALLEELAAAGQP